MKDHQAHEERISAYLDGELSEPERAELLEHIAACRDCQQYLDDLTAIQRAVKELEEVPVPEGFMEQVMAQVRTTEQDKAPKTIRFPQWRRWGALAACCALVLFGAWYFRNIRRADLAAGGDMVMATSMPQMTRAADVPESTNGGEDGTMVMMDEEQPADGSLSRMADGVSTSEMYEVETEDAIEAESNIEEYMRESAKDAPVPSPALPVENPSGGTLTAGGDIVRQWVEDELGLPWESGRIYTLTAEQYDELITILTESGAAFQVEAGDTCRLTAA